VFVPGEHNVDFGAVNELLQLGSRLVPNTENVPSVQVGMVHQQAANLVTRLGL
jgi:hypothetical protein